MNATLEAAGVTRDLVQDIEAGLIANESFPDMRCWRESNDLGRRIVVSFLPEVSRTLKLMRLESVGAAVLGNGTVFLPTESPGIR